jgi:hypothetical protein
VKLHNDDLRRIDAILAAGVEVGGSAPEAHL